MKDATTNQRTPVTRASAADPSTARTWSDAGPFKSNNRMRVTVGALAVAITLAAVVVLMPTKKAVKAPPEPLPADVTLDVTPDTATVLVDGAPQGKHFQHKPGAVRIEIQAEGYLSQTLTSLVPGPQTQTVALQKAAPKTHTVKIGTEPSEAEVMEGARLIGKTPTLWSDVSEGDHELTLQRHGYQSETVKVHVAKDDDFNFKLRKLESARKAAAPDLGIKAER